MLDVNACSLVFYKAEPDTSGKTLTPSVRGAAPRWRRRRGQRPVRRSGRADRAGRWHWALALGAGLGAGRGDGRWPGECPREETGGGGDGRWPGERRGRRPRARRPRAWSAREAGRARPAAARCQLAQPRHRGHAGTRSSPRAASPLAEGTGGHQFAGTSPQTARLRAAEFLLTLWRPKAGDRGAETPPLGAPRGQAPACSRDPAVSTSPFARFALSLLCTCGSPTSLPSLQRETSHQM